jgi:hypothetical protein
MSFRALSCAAVVLLAISTATVSLSQKPPNSQETVWFALKQGDEDEYHGIGKLRLDPLAIISGGKLSKVLDNCSDDGPAYQTFLAEYLNAGHSYSVLFGGGPAGSATLGDTDKSSLAPSVDYKGSARLHGLVMGLATNSVISQTGMSSRQTPTAAEHQSASKLAENLFANAGVPPDLLAKIRVRNLTHTLLVPSKSPSLIGSFSIEAGGRTRPTHNLFFIATFNGSDYAPELVWTRISKNEVESERVTFVDQGDLFGDGEEEVIVLDRGWEGYGYRIYRRNKNNASNWEQILEAPVFGCG